jgi:hypothetical protein
MEKMSPRSETWFDRLSGPHTRRQSLKAAAAGAAAAVGAGLPLAGKVAGAEAATPTDCRKGCVWTAGQRYATERRLAETGYWSQAVFAKQALGPVLGGIYNIMYFWADRQVADIDLKQYRESLKPCFQPNCPGFDPRAPGGPCDGCEPPLYCNPCDLVDNGYICCIYEPTDCHGDCCKPGPGCP